MKKESGRRKAFRVRVCQLLQRQGWEVKDAPWSSPVDITATRAGGGIRGFLIKAHGHISRNGMAALHKYGEVEDIGVVHVHEGSGHEILFSRFYKHLPRGQ